MMQMINSKGNNTDSDKCIDGKSPTHAGDRQGIERQVKHKKYLTEAKVADFRQENRETSSPTSQQPNFIEENNSERDQSAP